MTIAFRTILVSLLALAAGIAVMSLGASAQTPSTLPYRLYVPMTASDGVTLPPLPPSNLPPADPSYCPGNTGSNAPPSPPNSVLGLLTINGAQAPAGTIVQLTFDGKVGPAARTREAGGYRIDFAGGRAGCANQVGSAMGVRITGQVYDSGVKVGDPEMNPFLRFDIAIP